MIYDGALICLGIFIGTTYPFVWGMIKTYALKGFDFLKGLAKK